MSLHDGARKLPLHHLSVRVPWHDAAWDGTICRRPSENASCLVLKNIRDRRDDRAEDERAGQVWSELARRAWPPCIGERSGFMAPFDFTRMVEHPYSSTSKAHSNFAPTPFRHPAFSAPCLPFRWTLLSEASEIAQRHALAFRPELEDRARDIMGFNSAWVQEAHNQQVLLDTFFSAVEPSRSLAFFYAKRVPLSEDSRRVLIGVARVTRVGPAVEYEYSRPGPLRSLIWERSVEHSLRPVGGEGFLLPYHQILERAARDPALDPARFVAYGPEEHFDEFSYASELVTHDAAISALLACDEALLAASEVLEGDWRTPRRWISDCLGELWKLRGPCPGLGAALTAFGIEHGHLIAYAIDDQLKHELNTDPWPLVEQAFANPALLGDDLARRLAPMLCEAWRRLPDRRRALLKLLSRFALTDDQATRFYQESERRQARIDVTDDALLANPYLLYELDRFSPTPLTVGAVDRGLFPTRSCGRSTRCQSHRAWTTL